MGIESNKHQPIIRDQSEIGVKVIPVKVEQTDYKDSFHKFRQELLQWDIDKAKLSRPVLVNKKVQAAMTDYAYAATSQTRVNSSCGPW